MFAASMGGHFTELMNLNTIFNKFNSVLVTDNLFVSQRDSVCRLFKEIEYSKAWALKREETAGITTTRSRWQSAFTYAKMCIECCLIYYRHKPAVVISTGSYIAVPLFVCAKFCGAKTIYIESNARVYSKSKTGVIVEKLSDKIYVQWPEMLQQYPNSEYHGILL